MPFINYKNQGVIKMAKQAPDVGDYKYGFHDEDVSILDQSVV